jgi:hypothetical protein
MKLNAVKAEELEQPAPQEQWQPTAGDRRHNSLRWIHITRFL